MQKLDLLKKKIGQEVRVWDMAGYIIAELISIAEDLEICTIRRKNGETVQLPITMILG